MYQVYTALVISVHWDYCVISWEGLINRKITIFSSQQKWSGLSIFHDCYGIILYNGQLYLLNYKCHKKDKFLLEFQHWMKCGPTNSQLMVCVTNRLVEYKYPLVIWALVTTLSAATWPVAIRSAAICDMHWTRLGQLPNAYVECHSRHAHIQL